MRISMRRMSSRLKKQINASIDKKFEDAVFTDFTKVLSKFVILCYQTTCKNGEVYCTINVLKKSDYDSDKSDLEKELSAIDVYFYNNATEANNKYRELVKKYA